MATSAYPYNIPVSFHFNVNFGTDTTRDITFQEVGGLTAEMTTEELAVGGENRFTYRLPVKAKYGNLILKRGMINDSRLVQWFRDAIENFQFAPMDISVNLLDKEHKSISFWMFIQAYPVKWVISDFNANNNTLVIETIELAYQYFKRDNK